MASDTLSISKSSLSFSDNISYTDSIANKSKSIKESNYSVASTVTSSFLDNSEFSSFNQNDISNKKKNKPRKFYDNTKDFKKRIYKCILDEETDYLKNLSSNNQIEEIRDKHRNNLLHIACGLGRPNSVKTLVRYFPKLIEQLNDKQQKPIDVAIKHNQSKIVECFIHKMNIYEELFDAKKRPLIHLAAKNGANEVLKMLLFEMNKRQLCLDIKDSHKNTAAHIAAKYGHLECLQTLVEYNCDITLLNQENHTPCLVAELNSHNECVNYLTIVETCINMSIELVKLKRLYRECKSDNEALKIQMEETIAINNDFIYQRENSVHISLELMQKQINELENKFMSEIDRLKNENESLKVEINRSNLRSVEINREDFKKEIEICKKEFLNLHKNSNNFLSIDYKRIDNLKNRFEQMKLKNEYEPEKDHITNNDHIDILRKMHQETTHKLMIFRNAVKKFKNPSEIRSPISSSTSTIASSNYYETRSSMSSSSSSQYNSLFRPIRCTTINFDLENE
ncbi:unnamed protein product [Brachionus calyciflorus]|uniref:Uncharacterized protein n=1 Tax=Brachionus calyciflorus TaxID=104777 RepID=A0A813V7E9_9BILA|nr:unnamed protein product [Brachionus calyciflorus]